MVTAYVDSEMLGQRGPVSIVPPNTDSAVSWAAIFAGALAAAVLSLLLFMLGIGLGLSSVSVWSGKGADGETIGWAAIIWLAFTQLASAGVGGYIAGRLRTKWQGVHTDEVYFRDTAHGFLAWAFATILMVSVMGSVAGAALTGTVKAAGAVATGAATVAGGAAGAVAEASGGVLSKLADTVGAPTGKDANSDSGLQYGISGLMRSSPSSDQQKQDTRDGAQAQTGSRTSSYAMSNTREVATVLGHALKSGSLPNEDAQYLAQLVSQTTGISPEEAQVRVQKTFSQLKSQLDAAKQTAKEAEEKAKQAAEQARKATAYSMLWMFVVLLMGAFVGSVSATLGGRQRDA
ncbi:flagellar export protein FliJ [Ottowia thiooxydans]|uniref:flagellar export protein FliJ n=1 Tax=Ottowia thiooxydans TaxID=219182 RepID=UPI0003FA85F3|nr:flagellar export protein FliJ [Ottowia thiooxydans]